MRQMDNQDLQFAAKLSHFVPNPVELVTKLGDRVRNLQGGLSAHSRTSAVPDGAQPRR